MLATKYKYFPKIITSDGAVAGVRPLVRGWRRRQGAELVHHPQHRLVAVLGGVVCRREADRVAPEEVADGQGPEVAGSSARADRMCTAASPRALYPVPAAPSHTPPARTNGPAALFWGIRLAESHQKTSSTVPRPPFFEDSVLAGGVWAGGCGCRVELGRDILLCSRHLAAKFYCSGNIRAHKGLFFFFFCGDAEYPNAATAA